MRAWFAILPWCLAACGETDGNNVVIELTSSVTPLDDVVISVYGPTGAILLDHMIADDGPLQLPRRVRIAGGEREEQIRVFAWGQRADARVAFGHATAQLTQGREDVLTVRLAAPPADCDDDGVPDAFDGCVAIADSSQADVDRDGTTDACTPGASCSSNLVTNPDFEIATAGWRALSGATLDRVSPGHAGGFAAELCKLPTGTTTEYSLQDDPRIVPAPLMGARYRVDAWVRADAPAAQRIDLRVGEMSIPGNDPIDSMIAGVSASTEWQLVTTNYAIVSAAGASLLDVRLRVTGAGDGSCFQVDDVCVQQLALACP